MPSKFISIQATNYSCEDIQFYINVTPSEIVHHKMFIHAKLTLNIKTTDGLSINSELLSYPSNKWSLAPHPFNKCTNFSSLLMFDCGCRIDSYDAQCYENITRYKHQNDTHLTVDDIVNLNVEHFESFDWYIKKGIYNVNLSQVSDQEIELTIDIIEMVLPYILINDIVCNQEAQYQLLYTLRKSPNILICDSEEIIKNLSICCNIKCFPTLLISREREQIPSLAVNYIYNNMYSIPKLYTGIRVQPQQSITFNDSLPIHSEFKDIYIYVKYRYFTLFRGYEESYLDNLMKINYLRVQLCGQHIIVPKYTNLQTNPVDIIHLNKNDIATSQSDGLILQYSLTFTNECSFVIYGCTIYTILIHEKSIQIPSRYPMKQIEEDLNLK